MMKKMIIVAVAVIFLFCLCGCSPTITEKRTFEKYAMVKMPDGSIVLGSVQDEFYYDSGVVKLTIDGAIYVTNFNNVCVYYK